MTNETEPNPELQRLDMLIGAWEITMHASGRLGEGAAAQATFEWLEGDRYLIQRSTADDPFPDGISIIGFDEERDGLAMHYFDSRGVARVYDLGFDGETLEMSRPLEPGDFAQRFKGSVSEDGSRMEGRWEFSEDGKDWGLDFELTYEKKG